MLIHGSEGRVMMGRGLLLSCRVGLFLGSVIAMGPSCLMDRKLDDGTKRSLKQQVY